MSSEFVSFSYQTIIWTTQRLEELGMSSVGSRQLMNGQLITDSRDRQFASSLVIQLLSESQTADGPMPQTKEHILLAR